MFPSVKYSLLLPLAFVLAGCAASPALYDDPLGKLLDRTEGSRARWAAARQAEAEMRDTPERAKALQRLVVERGHPTEYSVYAVDQLLAMDEAAAKLFFAEAIVRIANWDVMKHLCDRAIERGWQDFIRALVRSYSITTPLYKDADRPERKAIEALSGVSTEVAAERVFKGEWGAEIRQRVGAWVLLCRWTSSREKIAGLLERGDERDSLITDLRAGWRELGILPDSVETVTWLRTLRSGLIGPFWERARGAVAELPEEQRRGIELRHLPVLVYLTSYGPEILRQNQVELLREIGGFVDSHRHHLKNPPNEFAKSLPQEFEHWKPSLAWADLVTVKLVTQWMGDREFVAAWFAEADKDLPDKTTELGGLIRVDASGRLFVQPYEPMTKRHDLIYIPPRELVLDGFVALAHYHFHAQQHDNGEFAGPGKGDMENIARTQRFNGLVLTFVDENSLNVDLYFAPDVVIDLGTIHR